MDYRADFYEARWHLDVAKRMFESYNEYGGKRFLVGVIREGAKAAGKLVRSFLIREGVKGDLNVFLKKVAPKYLEDVEIGGLVGILNVERDQRIARVEFVRDDEVLLEVGGKWKILKISRLREFVENVENIVKKI